MDDDEIRIINPNICNSQIKFRNPSGKLKRNTEILRSIFEWMTGIKVYKNTKSGLILYKNTESEMEGNFKILGIKFKGKRVTETNDGNNFTFNFEEYSDFVSTLKLAAKESLEKYGKIEGKERYIEPKLGEHKV